MGGLHSPRFGRYSVAPRFIRGRQGRAARRVGPAELGRAPLGRRSGIEPVTSLLLPASGRRIERYTLRNEALSGGGRTAPSFNRVAYAAAHVVVDPLAETDPYLQ